MDTLGCHANLKNVGIETEVAARSSAQTLVHTTAVYSSQTCIGSRKMKSDPDYDEESSLLGQQGEFRLQRLRNVLITT